MGYQEQLSSYSKTRKPGKYGKKIVKKVSSKINLMRKQQKQNRIRKHNYSPEYKREKHIPLYHSDDYKPSISEQDETEENYRCFITRDLVEQMREEQMNSQKDLLSKMANINL